MRATTWACGLLIGAAALAPLCLRGVLIAGKLGLPGVADVGGVVSDLAVAAAFGAALILFSRASRLLAGGALAFWALLHYANYENALALDALASYADLRFLGDETFVRGSALWVSSPVLLVGLVAAAALLGWLLAPRTGGALRPAGVALAASLVLFGGHALWMSGQLAVGWRYADFLQVNATRLWAASIRSSEQAASAAMAERLPALLANLDGEPVTPVGRPGRNVLLVFIEGLSGGYLPDNVRAHKTFVGPRMIRLNELARQGLSYRTFIVHQRRTNRGLYAGLCGELPNLRGGVPKMTSYIDGGTRVCLPHVLRDAGYRTVYLQAAPLAFMLKDQFMPLAGFDEVYGHDWFPKAYVRSVWGIDDRAYFEQSLEMVDRLEESGQPWFLTLLTVGTHHPTILPQNFETHKPIRFSRAVSYADQALDGFIRGLRERGVFDNTLVIITSDESRGISARRDEMTAALTQSWGFLVALVPEGTRMATMEAFGLMDISISVLDYLGLGEKGAHFFGRSLFRTYDTGRYLFFGNSNLHIVGALAPDGSLVYCASSLHTCRRYGLQEGRLFASERTQLVLDPEQARLVSDVIRRSVSVQRAGMQPRVYELVMTPEFRVARRHLSLIHGGQYIDIKKNQWLEVEIEFDARGGTHALEFEHYLGTTGGKKRRFFFDVRPGETLRFRYTFRASRDLHGVRCRSFARLTASPEMLLRFRKARMTVHSVGKRPAPGLVVHQNEKLRTASIDS